LRCSARASLATLASSSIGSTSIRGEPAPLAVA
jgi:hypothetical protein